MATPATSFQQSKIKEIALTDPDVKEITKQGVEVLKNSAEIFAGYLFQKCFEEAHRRKRTLAKIDDFINAVTKDDVLNVMLGQFLVNEKDLPPDNQDENDIENVLENVNNKNNEEEEEKEISERDDEDSESKLERIVKEDDNEQDLSSEKEDEDQESRPEKIDKEDDNERDLSSEKENASHNGSESN